MIGIWALIAIVVMIAGLVAMPKNLLCKLPLIGSIATTFFYPHEAVIYLERNNVTEAKILHYAIFTDKEGNQKVKFNKYIKKDQASPSNDQTLGVSRRNFAFGISTELDTVYWLTPENHKDKKMVSVLKEDKLREQFMVGMVMEMVRDYEKKEKWKELMPLALVVLVMIAMTVMSYMAFKQIIPLVEAIQATTPAFQAAATSFESAAKALGNVNPMLPPA